MKSCLVVDDSKVIRKVARRILEELDFSIEEAVDGQDALGRQHQRVFHARAVRNHQRLVLSRQEWSGRLAAVAELQIDLIPPHRGAGTLPEPPSAKGQLILAGA